MSKQVKLLRGQVRQIVNEILPDVLAGAMYAELAAALQKQLKDVEAQVKETLIRLDERSKDIQSYLVRQSMITTNPADVLTPKAEKSE